MKSIYFDEIILKNMCQISSFLYDCDKNMSFYFEKAGVGIWGNIRGNLSVSFRAYQNI